MYVECGVLGEVLCVVLILLLDELGEDDVCVCVFVVLVNLLDVNMIEGKYLVVCELLVCGGNEMVGEVTACGMRALARGARTGDRVVLN